MGTATISTQGEDEGRIESDPNGGGGGTCGVLAQMDDERIQLMGLIVRTNRRLNDALGRELEQTVGIPLVFFDVLIHVGAAPDGRLTMSRLSNEVALTTGGVTRLVDRMAEAGLVARAELPQRSPQRPRRARRPKGTPCSNGQWPRTSRGSTGT